MKNFPFKYFFAVALFLGVPAFLFFRGLKPGEMLGGYDIITLGMPFRYFAKEMLLKYHQMPLWMPCIFMGLPLIGSSNIIYFYPLNLIMTLLPVDIHNVDAIMMIAHMLIAAGGAYLFISYSGVSKKGSVAGAFVYMTMPYIVTLTAAGQLGVIQAAAFIPYTFYFVKKGLENDSLADFLAAGIFLAMESLCLMFQLAAYNAFALAIYLAFEMIVSGKSKKKDIIKFSMFFILCGAMTFLASAPQSLPSGEYMPQSWRRLVDYRRFTWGSLNPKSFFSLLLPDSAVLTGEVPVTFMGLTDAVFYMGLLPLIIMPFAFLKSGMKSRGLFWAALSLFFMALAMGRFTPLYSVFVNLPVFNGFRIPARFAYISCFGAAFLSGIAIDNIFDPLKSKEAVNALKYMTVSIVAAALLMFAAAGIRLERFPQVLSFLGPDNFRETVVNFVLPSIKTDIYYFAAVSAAIAALLWLLVSGRSYRNGGLILAALLVVHAFDTARIEKKYIHFMPADRISATGGGAAEFLKRQGGIFRVSFKSHEAIDNLNIYYNLETLQGYNGNAPYRIMAMIDGGLFDKISVRRRFNIRYYLDEGGSNEPGLKKVFSGQSGIYLDSGAFERFYISDEIVKASSEAGALSMLGALPDNSRAVVVEGGTEIGSDPVKLDYGIKVLSYTPNESRLKVVLNKRALLVNSSQLFKSSRVKVDGREGRLFNADYAATGLVLEKGEHEVLFYNSKASILWGIFLAALGLVIYLITAVMEKAKKKTR
jgi:hypothetical protein